MAYMTLGNSAGDTLSVTGVDGEPVIIYRPAPIRVRIDSVYRYKTLTQTVTVEKIVKKCENKYHGYAMAFSFAVLAIMMILTLTRAVK